MMKHLLLCTLLLSALPLCAAESADVRKGDKLYHRKKYGQALAAYQRALDKNPSDRQAAFGLGAASYYLKDYNTAEKTFDALSEQQDKLAHDAMFNLGTSYYRGGDNEAATAAYRKLLLQYPDDKEAVHNYQLILDEEHQQNNNEQNKDNNDDNQNDNDNNDGQDNNQNNNNNNNPPPPQDNSMNQDDADRVMQMARDSEYKQPPDNPGQSQNSDNSVEQDW